MTQTTKKAMAASLKERLEKTTLQNITVKDIVKDCEINRQTFYYHFQDSFALMEWIFETEGTKAISNNKTYDTWERGFLQAFQYVEQNKMLVLNAYHSMGREHVERYLYSVVYRLLINVINEQAKGMNVPEDDKGFIAHFYKYVFVGLMLEWIHQGMKECPKDIVDRLSKLITGDIHKALLKYEQ
ncbi:putative transcriptional regulator, TetR family [Alkaliphilus metalliredigens QYMF]|uniref:Putative transcriptional regulator, TetR family n=1 Tax=Alkaliphilus metalliredigens (strain QYMF) TaxID=293826 RepID=A6TJY5_ALKMQ|nr:TetR-like C-terminal domain-containing protein [Alkaliphilus metalliredigens]ABR46503.1 putative transcriptional regulator, TetR family [Alkaliphilus metalliredigens QYMF]